MGDVNGIIEHHFNTSALGLLNTCIIIISAKMIGSSIIVENCCPSCALSTAEPAAANSEA